MSFTFHWPRFSDQFHYDAIQMLNTALNKGNKPPIIADKIEVVELEMGTQPPELEIRDVGDLAEDHFRGIFRMTYAGDAHLVLKTKVQANPLNHKQPDVHLMGGSRGMLAAKQPLVVPMLLRLSHFRLSSYVVLVVSKQKGITLVFKTDPLQNVDINSTFDSIAVIQNFIQREIEDQLRQMFREDLPGIIHRLSQQWVKAKVEAPYLSKRPTRTMSVELDSNLQRHSLDARSLPDTFGQRHMFTPSDIGSCIPPNIPSGPPSSFPSVGPRRPRPASTSGGFSFPNRPIIPSPLSPPAPEPSTSSHPELENFDPTYGLRPEGLPTKSVFKGFSSLFTPNKGLADLAEEAEGTEGTERSTSEFGDSSYNGEDDDDVEGQSAFDFVDWDENNPQLYHEEPAAEYETIPAVGGGTITRPRVYHSQSAIQTHTGGGPSFKSISSAHPSRSFTSLTNLNMPSRPGYPFVYGRPRAPTPDSIESQPSGSRSSSGPSMAQTLSTEMTDHASYYDGLSTSFAFPPHESAAARAKEAAEREAEREATATSIHMRRSLNERRFSVTSNTTNFTNQHMLLHNLDSMSNSTGMPNGVAYVSSPQNHTVNGNLTTNNAAHDAFLSTSPSSHLAATKIVLRPSLNSSIHQLSTLSTSNHTLSPYTRDLSHFTVRSVPPRGVALGGGFGVGLGVSGMVYGGVGMQERQAVKAKRKRTYRLGSGSSASAGPSQDPARQTSKTKLPLHPNNLNIADVGDGPEIDEMRSRHGASSPTPPSEFDISDMDRYFRTQTLQDHDEKSETMPPFLTSHPSANLAKSSSPSVNFTLKTKTKDKLAPPPNAARHPSSLSIPTIPHVHPLSSSFGVNFVGPRAPATASSGVMPNIHDHNSHSTLRQRPNLHPLQ